MNYINLALKIFIIFVLTLLFISFSFFGYTIFIPSNTSDKEFVFDVKPNYNFHKVLDDLESKNIIRSKATFLLFVKIFGFEKNLKTGEFKLAHSMSSYDIAKILTSDLTVKKMVTISEGLNMYEIAELLSKKGLVNRDNFLNLCKNKSIAIDLLGENIESLEGYLFPETYNLEKYMDEKTIIKMMVDNFLKRFNNLSPKYNEKIRTRNEAVILASIIEKETGAGFERSKIASVFYNRLKIYMKLQSDPTIIYGILDKTGIHIKNIRKADILAENKYNTYYVNGLPSGAISNPGEESLEAVFYPDETDYLYFVSKNDGTHKFSKTYREHLNAVNLYQR